MKRNFLSKSQEETLFNSIRREYPNETETSKLLMIFREKLKHLNPKEKILNSITLKYKFNVVLSPYNPRKFYKKVVA